MSFIFIFIFIFRFLPSFLLLTKLVILPSTGSTTTFFLFSHSPSLPPFFFFFFFFEWMAMLQLYQLFLVDILQSDCNSLLVFSIVCKPYPIYIHKLKCITYDKEVSTLKANNNAVLISYDSRFSNDPIIEDISFLK
ncbi:hypothetical protein HMI56_003176 [Coelomomyces lativittatus]|nr:hypothetical protein HMI56_003176 [Coelomomyces lativittatus]